MNQSDERVAREASQEIAALMERVGLFCRFFARVKEERSADAKIAKKGYCASRRMQDLVGVRVTLYFADDVGLARDIVRTGLKSRFVSETVDSFPDHQFQPQRYNMIMRMKTSWLPQLSALRERKDTIDETYEVQLRTVLSEGWHEVEHDLRYKQQSDWEKSPELSRVLNGILASLEISDWSMLQIFDELSHRHYRERRWAAMLRNKFRLRGLEGGLSPSIQGVLDADGEFAKALFRTDRAGILNRLSTEAGLIPLSLDNLVYYVNHVAIHDDRIASAVPRPLQEQFERRHPVRERGAERVSA